MSVDPVLSDKHVTYDALGVAVVVTAFDPNPDGCAVCLSTVDVFADRTGPVISLNEPQTRALARFLNAAADSWGAKDDGRGVVLLLAVVVLVLLVAGGVGGLLTSLIPSARDLTPTCVVPTAAGCEVGP